jgi:hypothetical protein
MFQRTAIALGIAIGLTISATPAMAQQSLNLTTPPTVRVITA